MEELWDRLKLLVEKTAAAETPTEDCDLPLRFPSRPGPGVCSIVPLESEPDSLANEVCRSSVKMLAAAGTALTNDGARLMLVVNPSAFRGSWQRPARPANARLGGRSGTRSHASDLSEGIHQPHFCDFVVHRPDDPMARR